MNQPPVNPLQQQTDASHLKLLAIFHFVLAGLAVLGMGFILLHFLIMNSLLNNPAMWEGQHGRNGQPPPKEFWMIFQWFYALAAGLLVLACAGNLLSGLWLQARKNRRFSIAVAALNCCQIPLGTTLGVFTIIVLLRDSVRRTYQEKAAGLTLR
ncbi:MAG: hypothetical protein K9N23_11485 [Akkermansiaceae bacterium]|nr:hypothetical protein [Akkermansiaceae bacterium]MCF7732306.1 hypothetical protein [Akkermansiaceae bacterium]